MWTVPAQSVARIPSRPPPGQRGIRCGAVSSFRPRAASSEGGGYYACAVTRFRRLLAPRWALGLAVLGLLALGGCGGKISVDAANKQGAVLFNQRCSGCHSLDAANAYGSKPAGQIEGGERTNGPNFNQRQESKDDVLFAIRNGGFSGAIMPANVVLGKDAEAVAQFLDQYSGKHPRVNR